MCSPSGRRGYAIVIAEQVQRRLQLGAIMFTPPAGRDGMATPAVALRLMLFPGGAGNAKD